MGFIAVKCPTCGADVNLDSSREFGYCTYCGTKIIQDKIVVEHRDQVSIENLIERANGYLQQSEFENAANYYNRVLDMNPKLAIAYWGLLLCKLRSKSDNDLVEKASRGNSHLCNHKEFQDAQKYADESFSERLTSIESEIQKRQSAYLEEKKAENAQKKRIAIVIGIVIVVVIVLFAIVSGVNKTQQKKQEAEEYDQKTQTIYDNFLGKTFKGESVGSNNYGEVYGEYEWKVWMKFNGDGSVDVNDYFYDKTTFSSSGKQYYNGTRLEPLVKKHYDSFTVHINSYSKEVFIIIGEEVDYTVRVDSNNVPYCVEYDSLELYSR